MKELENSGHLKVTGLPADQFPCGAFFFQTDRREFAGDKGSECKECVAVHNNYVGTTQAKRYRMRETGQCIQIYNYVLCSVDYMYILIS